MSILLGGEAWCTVSAAWWLREKKGKCESTREGRGWATRCAARGGGWTQIGSRSDKATGILRNSKIGAAIAQSGNCRGRVVLRDVE